jgi:glycosyltransferase involved in cell wall biosynthesis
VSVPPDVSVVIATRDRPGRLSRQLAALRGQTLDAARFEVVVVDDGSGPETVALLHAETGREGGPALRVLRHTASVGPGAARNAGWRAARAPLIAFTDDDCEATPGWLEAYLAAATRHPGAILQGRVLPLPEEAASFGPFSHTIRIEGPTRGFETANILYPRDLLERVGGFDAASFTKAGGEDTDLAWKAMATGAEHVWVPEALAHHAVIGLGPLGLLRRATIWDETVLAYKRHPGLRRTLVWGIFWNREHCMAFRALVALLVPRRLWWLRWWLAAPYVTRLVDRRSGPLLAPYIVLRDAVEISTLLRGSWRYRTLVV